MSYQSRIFSCVLCALFSSSVACTSELDGKQKAVVSEVEGGKNAVPASDGKTQVTRMQMVADQSSVKFVGSKITGDHSGEFKTISGRLEVAATQPVKLEVVVDMASVIADADGLTKHLKKSDFFDVAKFAQATFTATNFKQSSKVSDEYEITGTLDFRGFKKELGFKAKVEIAAHSASGSAEFKINRSDFGVVYPGRANDLIKEEVLLKLRFKFATAK